MTISRDFRGAKVNQLVSLSIDRIIGKIDKKHKFGKIFEGTHLPHTLNMVKYPHRFCGDKGVLLQLWRITTEFGTY